ncbi:MAG TPA: heat-inducible transcriptional repressor HrcA [Gemmatimonadaceae bacterium]|jgi:heat-inducible transcriptional repressor|nr:heat-inducible transcriptional repressor HrcA [Gemmatimonadaceae bacterium]
MPPEELNRRERRVLEAVIRSYVETAEPAGSRTLSRRFGLGVSPATIRNTMSDLEAKGFLFHPHTSAGRVPTDKAYRAYVDSLLTRPPLPAVDTVRLSEGLGGGHGNSSSPIESILRRAAQTLGLLTQELGVAIGPRLDRAVLRRLELVRVSSQRLLMVLTLEGGVVRTVFVEVAGDIADSALGSVTAVLNERLGGLTIGQIRTSLSARLRDASADASAAELLNIFVQEGDQLFDAALPASDGQQVVLGTTSVLAEQPEFSAADRLRRLLALTETPDALGAAIRRRIQAPGISITIGAEHDDPRLEDFTLVTAEYQVGALAGVIGVIGPTRMPYDKVISLVGHTSRLLSDLLD